MERMGRLRSDVPGFWFLDLSKRSCHSYGCLTPWPFASPRESYQHHDTHCWKGGQKITRFWGLRKVHMECMLVGLALSTDIVFSFLLCTERTITRDWLGGQKCVCVCHWHWEWQWRRYYPLCHTFLFPHLSTFFSLTFCCNNGIRDACSTADITDCHRLQQ